MTACSAASSRRFRRTFPQLPEPVSLTDEITGDVEPVAEGRASHPRSAFGRHLGAIRIAVTAVMLTWIFYDTSLLLLQMFWRAEPLPGEPIVALEPFRIANQYGLFAVMTPHRYEIEFQGSNDGTTWTAYPFRYKPQDLSEPARASTRPTSRASTGISGLPRSAMAASTPSSRAPRSSCSPTTPTSSASSPAIRSPAPRRGIVRAVLWQYWFSLHVRRSALPASGGGAQLLGTYAPTIQRMPDGRFVILQDATLSGPQ